MKRAIVIVIDSMGCGAMNDCRDYNDVPECNTLCNVAKAVGGLNVPTFEKMGLGNLGDVMGVSPVSDSIAQPKGNTCHMPNPASARKSINSFAAEKEPQPYSPHKLVTCISTPLVRFIM